MSAGIFVALVIAFFAGLNAGTAGMYYVTEQKGLMLFYLLISGFLIGVVVFMVVGSIA